MISESLRRWGKWALAAFALSGCSEFDPGSRVTDFRLIAVQADKPYAAPGEKVHLQTLSHEPFGRPVTWAWTTCVKPRDTTVNACLAKIAEDARANGGPIPISMGEGKSTFDTTVPSNVLDGVEPRAAGNVLVGVLTVACPGALSLKDPNADGELPFRCADANTHEELPYDRYVVSVKRIFVRNKDRNQNPSIGTVTWDGTPWPESEVKEVTACDNSPAAAYNDCSGGDAHEMSVVVPDDAVESGTSEFGVPFREDIVVQYYATEGLFEFEARVRESPATSWKARKAAAGKEQTLWFVVREGRGGVNWTTRKVRVK